MAETRAPWALGLVASVSLLAACGGGAPQEPVAPTPTGPQVSDVERYLPLVSDTVLAYDTENDLGARGVLMMQITRSRPDLAELRVAGRAQRLAITPEGIRQSEGGWVLKAPLSQGTRFKGDFGDVVVSAIGKRMSTPAGEFSDCIETIEKSSNKQVTTTYCRDVGIVELLVEGQVGEEYARERAVLKSHGPRVDLGTDLPPPPPKR